MQMEPSNPTYMEALARVYIERGVRLEEARELLEKALSREDRPAHKKWIKKQLSKRQLGNDTSTGRK